MTCNQIHLSRETLGFVALDPSYMKPSLCIAAQSISLLGARPDTVSRKTLSIAHARLGRLITAYLDPSYLLRPTTIINESYSYTEWVGSHLR